jgi:hypothetical protein
VGPNMVSTKEGSPVHLQKMRTGLSRCSNYSRREKPCGPNMVSTKEGSPVHLQKMRTGLSRCSNYSRRRILLGRESRV